MQNQFLNSFGFKDPILDFLIDMHPKFCDNSWTVVFENITVYVILFSYIYTPVQIQVHCDKVFHLKETE